MRNRKGQCVSPKAYQDFIEQVVDDHGGVIREDVLDDILIEKYQPHWGKTDLRPWGAQRHDKWSQNVASAKAGLDRRGVIVRYETMERIPIAKAKPGWKVMQSYNRSTREQQLYRIISVVYRVRLPEQIFRNALYQWRSREQPKRKKQYEPLVQPDQVYVVPK